MRERIETERLILRPVELRDAPDIHRHCLDGSVARYTARIPHPYPLLAAELYVLSMRAMRGKKPVWIFAITDRLTDRMVGACGIFKRYGDASDWEIGYWVGPEARRKGYASEAAEALISAAIEDLHPQRIIAGHFEDNPGSGRVLERLGFSYTGETTNLFCMGRMENANSLDMVRHIG